MTPLRCPSCGGPNGSSGMRWGVFCGVLLPQARSTVAPSLPAPARDEASVRCPSCRTRTNPDATPWCPGCGRELWQVTLADASDSAPVPRPAPSGSARLPPSSVRERRSRISPSLVEYEAGMDRRVSTYILLGLGIGLAAGAGVLAISGALSASVATSVPALIIFATLAGLFRNFGRRFRQGPAPPRVLQEPAPPRALGRPAPTGAGISVPWVVISVAGGASFTTRFSSLSSFPAPKSTSDDWPVARSAAPLAT